MFFIQRFPHFALKQPVSFTKPRIFGALYMLLINNELPDFWNAVYRFLIL